MNEIIGQNELEKKIHELGFANERELLLYIKLRKSLEKPVKVGIAA